MGRLNLVLRFGLELAMVGVLAWWGAGRGGIPLALGAPAAAAVLWGAVVSPKARFAVGPVGRAAAETLLFGAAAFALVDLGHPVLGAVFAAAALVSGIGERVLAPPAWAAPPDR